ncbi:MULTISPECIES: hypothetical protein [unclassified Colwellia]|jgi:hypothetical protein|nr:MULTISPECIES: hypothetical protein [unclassified Colwellia]
MNTTKAAKLEQAINKINEMFGSEGKPAIGKLSTFKLKKQKK